MFSKHESRDKGYAKQRQEHDGREVRHAMDRYACDEKLERKV